MWTRGDRGRFPKDRRPLRGLSRAAVVSCHRSTCSLVPHLARRIVVAQAAMLAVHRAMTAPRPPSRAMHFGAPPWGWLGRVHIRTCAAANVAP